MPQKASSFKFNYYKDYINFLFSNCFEEVVDQYIKIAEEIQPGWIKWFKDLDEFKEYSKTSLFDFFSGVLNDTALEVSKEALGKWRRYTKPQVPELNLSIEDIVKNLTVRRMAVFHFLEKYTTDISLILKIYNEIETFYGILQEHNIHAFIEIYQKELHNANEELKASEKELQANNEELLESHEELQVLHEELRKQVEEKARFEEIREKERRENAQILQEYNHKLEKANADLHEKQRELQAINEELRENQEELHAINEELREQITQRVDIEAILRTNEQKYRDLYEKLEEAQEIAHVGSWEFNIKSKEVFWSAELYRIFGYRPFEIDVDYNKYLSHIHPDFLALQHQTIEEAIQMSKDFVVEHKILTKSGREKWILGRGKIELDKDGNPSKIKGIAKDITSTKSFELEITNKNQELTQLLEELQSAEEHLIELNDDLENRVNKRTKELEILNDTGKTISYELDLDKIVQRVTDSTTQITGAEFGAFFYNIKDKEDEHFTLYTISGVPREKFSPFPMPRNTEIFSPTFKGEGIIRSDDITLDPRYGHNKPYQGIPEGHPPVKSYLAVPVISRNGTVLGGLFFGHSKAGIFKESAEALVEGIASQAAIAIDNSNLYESVQANEQRLKMVLESMPTMAWTSDEEGQLDYFNPQYYKFTGRNFNTSKGFGWIEAIHMEDLQLTLQEWKKSIATGEDFVMECRMKNQLDNNYRWQLCRAVPLRDKNGRITKWFGTCTDVNEQKITNHQLLETNKELLKVNEFLDTFVYIAAHDLRSPLSNLRMILDLLNKTGDSDKKQEFLNALSISVNKLDQTVNGLVKIIEIQSTDNSAFKYLKFEDILANVKEDYSHRIKEIDSKIISDFSASEGIKFIEAYLISIVKNIVGNALKYSSPKRPLVITLKTEKVAPYTLLTISDNGVGMDIAKYGKNIFKPFTRFSKIADGKGLGLYLVKNMLEKNEGKIEVESTIDVGTTFKIYLKEY